MSGWRRALSVQLSVVVAAGFTLASCSDSGSTGAENPTPSVTSLSPATATAGGAGFTLTVNGSNFIAESVLRWGGVTRPTTHVSDSQLTMSVSAEDIASGGTVQVTVFNPSPGGGQSSSLAFSIENPMPSVTSMSRNNATVGAAGFILAVNGGSFVPGSVVRWGGADRPTTYVSGDQITASISESDLLSAGTVQVTVFNSTPGGGESSPLAFNVDNPIPSLTFLTPPSATAGGPGFTLSIAGTAFISGSVVRWDGADRATTFVSNTLLTASIFASDLSFPSVAQVTVFNPSPGGGESGALPFTVSP